MVVCTRTRGEGNARHKTRTDGMGGTARPAFGLITYLSTNENAPSVTQPVVGWTVDGYDLGSKFKYLGQVINPVPICIKLMKLLWSYIFLLSLLLIRIITTENRPTSNKKYYDYNTHDMNCIR